MRQKKALIVLFSILTLALIGSFFIDQNVTNWIVDHRIPILNLFFVNLTHLGGFVTVPIFGIIAYLCTKKHKRQIVWIIITTAIAGVLALVLKYIIARPRPDVLFLVQEPKTMSFPSGHATAVFMLLPMIWQTFPRFRWVWLLFASLVAISRVYIGVHYLSDVIAGAFLGLTVGLLCLKYQKKKH